MDDKPAGGLRKKKDSSMARAIELVREGKADAVISLGNTGGILAAGHVQAAAACRRGTRPASPPSFPRRSNEFVLLDAGANIECKPLHLAQFAVMGSIYSREVLGCKKPRVGILSNGTEETKGNELTCEAFKLCKQLDLNFIGNVEGHDLFKIMWTWWSATVHRQHRFEDLREPRRRDVFDAQARIDAATPSARFGAYLAKNAFHAIKRRMDPEVYGGAPLLGLNGMVIKAHGSARERAITNAIRVTTEALQHQVNQIIAREIARANEATGRR